MKPDQNGLARRYRTALGRHLKGGSATVPSALTLGRRAAILGWNTLELARVHEQSLSSLGLSGGSIAAAKRGGDFFNQALTPLLEKNQSMRAGTIRLNRLNEALERRTVELASMNGQLERGIRRRKSVEEALRKSTRHYKMLLRDSLRLQGVLRQLMHRVLTAQEDERRKMSRELQDEVAQTLLGINVRLASLKLEARSNTQGLKNEIASTELLVANSVRSVRQVARKLRDA